MMQDTCHLLERLAHSIAAQRAIIDSPQYGSVEREAARLAYAAMRDAAARLAAERQPYTTAPVEGETGDGVTQGGWVLVPREPTVEMLGAVFPLREFEKARADWYGMIATAPANGDSHG